MKKVKHLLILLSLSFSTTLIAQVKKTDTSTTEKKENLLDMQSNAITSILGENFDGNTTGGSIGFLELLEKADLPEAQKKEYQNLYHLQSKDLNERQKDSLGNAIGKKMLEAKTIDE